MLYNTNKNDSFNNKNNRILHPFRLTASDKQYIWANNGTIECQCCHKPTEIGIMFGDNKCFCLCLECLEILTNELFAFETQDLAYADRIVKRTEMAYMPTSCYTCHDPDCKYMYEEGTTNVLNPKYRNKRHKQCPLEEIGRRWKD